VVVKGLSYRKLSTHLGFAAVGTENVRPFATDLAGVNPS
jgi:hypothetical protein